MRIVFLVFIYTRVRAERIEPSTFSTSTRRSTTELSALQKLLCGILELVRTHFWQKPLAKSGFAARFNNFNFSLAAIQFKNSRSEIPKE